MSDVGFQPRVRATRARSLGDAVPVFRGFRPEDEPTIEPKSNAELRAERDEQRDQQPMIVRCYVDGCTWTHKGTFRAGRDAAISHRKQAHPSIEAGVRRCQTPGCTRTAAPRMKKCGTCSFNDRLARAQNGSKAAKAARSEELLEEAASARGDDGAASSSSTLDTLAEINPEPQASVAAVEPLVAATALGRPASTSAAVTARTSSGEVSASTTTERIRMRRTWTRETLIAKLQAVAGETGHTPTSNELIARKLSSLTTPKFLRVHGFDSFSDLCEAAGLKPNSVGRHSPGEIVVPPTGDGGSLAELARELEDARVDVNRANARWLDAITAFKAHDVIRQIPTTEGEA